MKKLIAMVIVLALGITVLAGCNNIPAKEDANSNKDINNSEEFIGKFSGSAGFMEFKANEEVQINFSDEHVWDLYTANFNTSHSYQFVTEKKETVTYDKADYLNLLNIKDDTFFYALPCKVEKNKITLYPGDDFEAVFDKEGQ